MQKTGSVPKLIMRADKSGYIVFSCLWLPIIVLSILAIKEMYRVHQYDIPSFLLSSLGPAVVILPLGLILLWLCKFRLTIHGDAVCYKTLFSKERCVSLSDIQYAKYVMGDYLDGNMFKPFVRLELYSKSIPGKIIMMVNVKVFSRSDLQTLQQILKNTGIGII